MDIPDIGYRATVPSALRRAATEFGEHEFIVTPVRRITYAEADEASRGLAKRLLAVGIGKGTRLAVLDTFGVDWVVALLAATRIGALFMPLPSTYRPAELARGLRHGDAHALVVPSTLLGRDMEDFVEEAIPDVRDVASQPLFVADLPYLRHVYVEGMPTRRWAEALDPGPQDGQDHAAGAVSDHLLEQVESAVAPADLMVVIFTSGATGEPKGVVHTHGTQVRHGWNLARNFGAGTSPDDRVFCALPFFWIGGLTYQLMGALSVGSTILCVERFTPEAALALMERERATRMVGWASQIKAVAQHPALKDHDLSTMAMFQPRVGRAADPELRHTSLGMTETSGPHTACPPEEAGRVLPDSMRGSFGRSLPYIEHRIIDPESGATLAEGEPGEIRVRGYSLLEGLYKHERREVLDDDGWFRTGDRGVFRDGYLYFLGRVGEMIKSAGANVAPREVEVALETVPEVQMAIVVALPDAARGEIVAAVVVPKPGADIEVDDILNRMRSELSSYKIPRRIDVVSREDVPWLPTGKPDKRALIDMLLRTSASADPA